MILHPLPFVVATPDARFVRDGEANMWRPVFYWEENGWHDLLFGIAKGNLHWLDVCCSSLVS